MPTADFKKWFKKRQLSEGEAACLLVGLDPDQVRLPLPDSILDAAEELRRAVSAGELYGWSEETDDDFHRLFGDGEDGSALVVTGWARYYNSEDLIDWADPAAYPRFPLRREESRSQVFVQVGPTATESTVVQEGPNQRHTVVAERLPKKHRRPPMLEVKRRREIVNQFIQKPSDFKDLEKVNRLFSELDSAGIPLPSRGGSSARTGTYLGLKRDLQKKVMETLKKDLQRSS